MTMRGKKIFVRAIGIHKEIIGGSHAFLEVILKATIILNKKQKTEKCKTMYDVFFFQVEVLSSLKNAWLPQIVSSDTNSTC